MSARRRRNQPDDGFDLPEENGESAEYETADDGFDGAGSGEEYPEEYPEYPETEYTDYAETAVSAYDNYFVKDLNGSKVSKELKKDDFEYKGYPEY